LFFLGFEHVLRLRDALIDFEATLNTCGIVGNTYGT